MAKLLSRLLILESRIFHITNVSFNEIRENKNLAKISESTVFYHHCEYELNMLTLLVDHSLVVVVVAVMYSPSVGTPP